MAQGTSHVFLEQEIIRRLPRAIKGELINVRIAPSGVQFQRRHSPMKFPTMPWELLFEQACKLEAERIRQERIARRKERRDKLSSVRASRRSSSSRRGA